MNMSQADQECPSLKQSITKKVQPLNVQFCCNDHASLAEHADLETDESLEKSLADCI